MTKLQLASTLGLDIPPDDEEEIAKRKKQESEHKSNEPGNITR
jgi:hypothetical protein